MKADDWNSLDENWKDLFAINYIYQYRFNENMRKDLVAVGINPFEHYRNKLNKDFVRFEPNDKKLQRLSELTLFYASNCNLETLKPLSIIDNLEILDVSFNNLTSLTNAGDLSSLRELYLEKNRISSLDPIVQASQLQVLFARNNDIVDATFLSGKEDLVFVDISSNAITSLDALKQSSTLKELQFSNNQIVDISFLNELKELNILECDHNEIKDPSPIFDLQKLKYINVAGNKFDSSAFNWESLTATGVEIILD